MDPETTALRDGQRKECSALALAEPSLDPLSTTSVEMHDYALPCQDSHARSIAKALSYRVAGSAATTVLAWALTNELKIAAAIGLGDTVVKLALFYLHERAWDRLAFGRKRTPNHGTGGA